MGGKLTVNFWNVLEFFLKGICPPHPPLHSSGSIRWLKPEIWLNGCDSLSLWFLLIWEHHDQLDNIIGLHESGYSHCCIDSAVHYGIKAYPYHLGIHHLILNPFTFLSLVTIDPSLRSSLQRRMIIEFLKDPGAPSLISHSFGGRYISSGPFWCK